MKPDSDHDTSATAEASRELATLRQQAEQARTLLTRLKLDVVEAEKRLDTNQAARLIEANEQLVLAMVRAQTEAVTAAAELDEASRSAEIDSLTGLPNRMLLLDRFTHAIASAKRHKACMALLFVDLDNFKTINDTLGHAVGDEVLKRAAHCFSSSVREADTVSRFGGDEFVILLADVGRASDAAHVAKKVIAALAAERQVGGHAIALSVSIGIAIYPTDGEDAATLIDRADTAMYRAKRQGRGGFALHGKELAGELGETPPATASPTLPLSQYEHALSEHKDRHGQLREANQHLVLAALSAQELQAAAETAYRKQTEFLAVLAHELRNPLTPIRTAAALLSRVRNDAALLAQVQAVIERQVVHMTRLVGDLLDVSRVHTGKLRIERRPVDMGGIIDAAVDSCRPAMQARQQRFDMNIPACALETEGDPVRLAQIISNLLDNASKYTPNHGEIELSVMVVGHAIVITVADNGIGITALALPTIFEPFMQDTHAIGFNGVGLGIGLTVVRELVEAHDGTVIASSGGTGLGSEFVVTLPLPRAMVIGQPA